MLDTLPPPPMLPPMQLPLSATVMGWVMVLTVVMDTIIKPTKYQFTSDYLTPHA
jgi:hypothetical protein